MTTVFITWFTSIQICHYLNTQPRRKMFQTAANTQTQKLWIWRLEYLHHEQRPLYFGEWF